MAGAIALLILFLYVFLSAVMPGLALITCPLATALCVFLGVGYHDNIIAISVAIIFIPVVLLSIILIRRESDDEEHWPRRAAKWSLAILISAAVLLLLVPLAQFGLSPAIFLLTIFISFIIRYKIIARYSLALYVFSSIGASIRQNLPLATALDSAAADMRDIRGRTLRRISHWLSQGYSISESLRQGYPKCPGQYVAMVSAGETSGQLGDVMRSIEADILYQNEQRIRIKPVELAYPLTILAIAFVFMCGLVRFILPKLFEVIHEMAEGAVLPKATQILVGITGWFTYRYGWMWLFGVVAVWLFLYIRSCFRRRRIEKPYLLSCMGDFFKWYLPGLHFFELNYSMVQVVGLLKSSLNSGHTVNRAIAGALSLDINICFKAKLRRWLGLVEQGGSVSESARKCGLPNSIVWAFDDKLNRANTPVILEMLEEFYRSNYSYKINLVRFVMFPVTILMLGCVVAFVVYSVFAPLVQIIYVLASDITPV
ncbi:MAG: type II secretion system F family protein [Planctomycetota bacterium]